MSLLSRLRNLVRSNDLSHDIEREMRFHLDERADDLVAAGMPADAARHEARRRFGNVGIQQERTRERDLIAWLDTFAADLRYALRALRAAPAFTLVAVLSLGLGIGANTAIFTIVNAVMLRSLPVSHPEQLVAIETTGGNSYFTNPIWEQLRDRQDVFSGAFAYAQRTFDLSNGGEARRGDGNMVSGDFFTTLGVRPIAGRLLTTADDRRGCAPLAVVSDGFAASEYGGAEAAVGKLLSLNGHPFRVVGVTDPRFTGINVGERSQIYVPLCSIALLDGGPARLEGRSNWYLHLIGRPKTDLTTERIDARLATLAPSITEATVPPQFDAKSAAEYRAMKFVGAPAANGFSELRTTYRKALLVLMAIVAVVLLIACANVANLLLARATVRRRELAVRLALGAGRARLFRQLLTESVLLSTIGAAVGALFAVWGSRMLLRLLERSDRVVTLDLSLDMRVLSFTILISVITGLLFGLAPAWRAGHLDPQAAMKAQSRGLAEGHSRFNAGKALVAAQVALSLVLVAAAGLLLGSWRTLATLDPGFQRDHVLLVTADLGATAIKPELRRAAYTDIVARLRAIPGVQLVGQSQMTPAGQSSWNDELQVDGYVPRSPHDALAWMNAVGESYFASLRIPLLAGRDFSKVDTPESPHVAIVSREMARHFFGSTNAIGRRFRISQGRTYGEPIEIVGVVGDTKYRSLRDSIQPVVYLAASQEQDVSRSYSFEVRTTTPPLSVAPSVKAAVAAVNPKISLDLTTLERQIDESLAVSKTIASLAGFFGVLALVLATIGLYGIMAYNVARRRNEIGVRIALGALPARVIRMVLGEVGQIVVAGVALGVALSLVAMRIVATFLYGTTPTNAPTLAGAGAILLVVGIAAAALPAWRAARLDPVSALREE